MALDVESIHEILFIKTRYVTTYYSINKKNCPGINIDAHEYLWNHVYI